MRRFLAYLLSRETPQEKLINRLLDTNEKLLDRLLESRGLEGLQGIATVPAAPSTSPSDDAFDEDAMRKAEERAEVEEYAANAAARPELFEQALYNSIPGNHPQAERWKEVVKRAEQMKVLVS